MFNRATIAAILLALGFSQLAPAQEALLRQLNPRVASRPEVPSEKEIRSKRHEVSSRLDAAIRELNRIQETDPAAATTAPVSQEVDLLKQREAVLAQQQTAKSKKEQQAQRIEELQKQIEEIRSKGLPEQPPYSFILFDQIRNDLKLSKIRLEGIEAAVTAASEAVSTARQAKDNKDSALRIAKEAVAANRTAEKVAELESAAKLAEIEAKLAEDTLNLRRLAHENEQLNKQVLELTIQLNEAKLNRIEGKVRFSDSDLQEIFVQIELKEEEIRQSKKSADSNLQYAEREWSAARRKVDQSDSPEAREELAARRVARNLRQQQLDVLNRRLERLTKSREVWHRRAKVFNAQATNEELTAWAAEARDNMANLTRERRVQEMGSNDVRKEITALETRLQSLNEQSAALRPWIEDQLELWRESLLTNDRNLASIDTTLQVHQDLLTDIEGDIQRWTFGERLSSAWTYVTNVWNTEVLSIDERPITVSKVVIGFLLLLLGLFAARVISRILGNRLLTRFGMNEGAVAALKSLTFYTLVVIFTLLALRFANVPLTVFTLVGGALAIGLGFGSQAIINNFISGLILIAERPIQVGDLVRLDDLIGNVTHIGARSTRIRTGDNLDIIVPNSKFLETNVLNFTLGDDKFRSHIKVGIAYGSPTRDATRLLIKAAEEHGKILAYPKPFVWFRDFGDNSLLFELHVWIKVRTLGERLRIESDLRYRVDQLFREAHIVIAFPQRDVHLDLAKPLDIRMISNEAEASSVASNLGDAA